MAKSTRALANPPKVFQAPSELDSLREALHATWCLHRLAALAQKYRNDEYFVTLTELHALVRVVNAEFKRRLRAARAAYKAPLSPNPTSANSARHR